MRIALITIHYQSNYGAVLQAFATKKVLSLYGEVETINYFNPYLMYKLDLVRFEASISGIFKTVHDILRFRYRSKLVKRFKYFLESNMNLSKLVTEEDIHSGIFNDFDVYVCGSDQIWKSGKGITKNKEYDPAYFLSFANKKAKKIYYASSMGGNYRLTDAKKERISELLRDFTTISVREKEAQEVLSQLLKRDVFHVLDPTLLLSKEEWFEALKIAQGHRSQEGDYILVYAVQKSPLVKRSVEFFSKQYKNKVVIIDQALKPLVAADVHIRDAGPLEFIELFANANLVITDSFHGMCFSVNFKKPFVPIRPIGGANRIEGLLNLLDLKDKLISCEKDICQVNTNNFDYESIEDKLKYERAKSIEVLRSSIVS